MALVGGRLATRCAAEPHPPPDVVEAYDLFSNRRDGVLKVAIRP
jgi:hypothetical protein